MIEISYYLYRDEIGETKYIYPNVNMNIGWEHIMVKNLNVNLNVNMNLDGKLKII